MGVRLDPSCPLKFHNCVVKWGHLTPQQEVKVKSQHVCPFLVCAVVCISWASRFPSRACPFPGNLSPCFIWAESTNMWLVSREQAGVITANKAKRAWRAAVTGGMYGRKSVICWKSMSSWQKVETGTKAFVSLIIQHRRRFVGWSVGTNCANVLFLSELFGRLSFLWSRGCCGLQLLTIAAWAQHRPALSLSN